MPWKADEKVGDRSHVFFTLGRSFDYAGWWYPRTRHSFFAVWDHATAPGAKQVMYPAGRYIELWGGNNQVFEEAGRMLPAFGSYAMTLTMAAADGFDPDAASEFFIVAAEKTGDGWVLTLNPTRPIANWALSADDGKQTRTTKFAGLAVDRPITTTLSGLKGDSLAVKIVGRLAADAPEQALFEATFPVSPGEPPRKTFETIRLQTVIRDEKLGEMPGGAGAFAELTDLTAEHQLSLPRWYGSARKQIEARDWPDDLWGKLDLFRRAIRAAAPSDDTAALIDAALAQAPDDPHANLYKAIQLLETGKADAAAANLAKARSLPGGRWLLALDAARGGQWAQAIEHVDALAKMAPADTFGPQGRDVTRQYLQAGATIQPTRPLLLKAIALDKLGKSAEAKAVLNELVKADPALIEARLLLDDTAALKTLTAANPAGLAAARRTLAALTAGRWSGIGRP